MNQSDTVVTVIILTYNQEAVVGDAIDSVLNQDCSFRYEILIGEDGSTDGTRSVCLRYAEKYPDIIRIMPAAPNKGLVDNYFDCVEEAKGRYIADCAGDDRWCHRGKLREMVGRLEDDPTLTAVYSDTIAVYPPPLNYQRFSYIVGHPEWSDGGRHSGADILKAVLNNTNYLPYILSSAIYRRSSLMEVMKRAPEMVRNSEFGIEDVPVIAALASEGDALHFPGVTLEYVQGEETISNSRQPEKQIRFCCRSILCSHTLCRYYGLKEDDLADHFRTKSLFVAANSFNSGSSVMRDLTLRALEVWHLKLPAKARIHLLLMKNRLLWKAARVGKQIIGLGKD